MSQPKSEIVQETKRHFSVGALIEKDGKYLLIDRVNLPYGFAGPAGHVDEGENPEEAIVREVKEETGLEITHKELLFEEFRPDNRCVYGVDAHHWKVYRCRASGSERLSEQEVKSMGWYAPEQIAQMQLEPVWELWFRKLGIIPG